MYLTLDEDRLAILARWAEWTERESYGQVIRVYRDHARERAALHADRERRLAQMTWRTRRYDRLRLGE